MGYAMQPGWEHFAGPDGIGPAEQDDKNGLERVLRVFVAEYSPTDAPHHRAMALDHGSEGGLIATVEKAAEQLRIGQANHRGLASAFHCPADLGHVDPSSSRTILPLAAVLMQEIIRQDRRR
jgi:hypothetical protein